MKRRSTPPQASAGIRQAPLAAAERAPARARLRTVGIVTLDRRKADPVLTLPFKGRAGVGMGSRVNRDRSSATLRLAIQGREKFAGLPARSTLRRWVSLALEGTPEATFTLRFVDAREGRRINRTFRHRNHATNVLTFAYAGAPRLAADIVLCVPVIEREARSQGKSRRAHLAHLVIHGVLHARGFEHDQPAAMRRMETREIALLAALRIGNPYRMAK